jgi:predicted metal-dependent HD superfamily phosphohydrolase
LTLTSNDRGNDLGPLLRARFTDVLPEHGEVADQLLERYAEGHRRYHDQRHLAYVLDRIDELATAKHDLYRVRLAAWFHDAVYDIPARELTNEEASARLSIRTLARCGLEQEDLGEIARLVRLTETHRPTGSDPDGELLCDADLAILAAEPEVYRRYLADVRAEYAAVDDHDFDRGRLAVLMRFGGRAIYRTSRGRKLNHAAQANLLAEANELIDRLGIRAELDPDTWPLTADTP